MSDPTPPPDLGERREAPPADRRLLTVAGVMLALPLVGLLWVGSYARIEPRLGGFPFFIWYQFAWVVICSALTYGAYRLVLRARPHVPIRHDRLTDDGQDAS